MRSLRKFYARNAEAVASRYSTYDSTPTTFVVASHCQDVEFLSLVQRFHELQAHNGDKERLPAKHCEQNVWLIKPAAQNQGSICSGASTIVGRGIEIFHNDILAMKKFLLARPPGSYWVVQKYIEKPLLYYGRKFDIRMWAVATWKQEFYYYHAGYVRTSSSEYTLDDPTNYVHLTNNCLQQYGTNYGRFEDGNTLGFGRFIKFLREKHPGVDFDRDIVGRMRDLMIDTYLATKGELNQNGRRNCFELLGYDFMIDEDLRVWLIEVNTNPYLGIPNRYIEGLLPKMLNDLLEIVLDPCVAPANRLPERDLRNQFELLYDETSGLNRRREYSLPLYPLSREYAGLHYHARVGAARRHSKDIFHQRFPIEGLMSQIYRSLDCENGAQSVLKQRVVEYIHALAESKAKPPENAVIEAVNTLKRSSPIEFFGSPIFAGLVCLAFDPDSCMLSGMRQLVVLFRYARIV